MLWPLDEGAAVPLCVRTVDQGAPDGGLGQLFLFSSSGLHVCAAWVSLADGVGGFSS
jgi:hypothetical protein